MENYIENHMFKLQQYLIFHSFLKDHGEYFPNNNFQYVF